MIWLLCIPFFASGFFHVPCSPKPPKITLASFHIFRKFTEKFGSKGAPPEANLSLVSMTPAANLLSVSTTPVATLPPVSTTLAAYFATGTAGVVDTDIGVNDTGGKFAASVNNTGDKLPPVSRTAAANLPWVSMTPVANNGINIRMVTP